MNWRLELPLQSSSDGLTKLTWLNWKFYKLNRKEDLLQHQIYVQKEFLRAWKDQS